MEQVQCATKPAVVTLFSLFEPMQVGVEIFFTQPRSAINTLEHGVAVVTAPIGASQLHQLERFGQLAGGRQMRATADVEPLALPVDREFLARLDDVFDDLDLVLLANGGKGLACLIAAPDLAHDRQVTLHDLGHARLDARQIVWSEGLAAGEVVVEAVFNRRADGHLRAGIELLHRLRHDVGGVVAHQLKGVVILGGDDGEADVAIDAMAGVDQLAVNLARQRCFGQARADAGCHLGHSDRTVEIALRTVGQGDANHAKSDSVNSPRNANARTGRARCWVTMFGRRDWIRTNDPHHVKVVL